MTTVRLDPTQPRIQPATMIIPKPLFSESTQGRFTFRPETCVCLSFHADPGGVWFIADELAQHIRALTGRFVTNRPDAQGPPAGAVVLTDHDAPHDLGEEGYVLEVTPDRITLRAAKLPGLFYAWQSLRQLLTHHSHAQADASILCELPCVTIKDKPRFGWRGFMLDSARHFQPVELIYKLIDRMAALKLNRLHWHLADDQGWRLEVLSYPRLTSVGAWRNNGRGRYGGFYTQEQIRDVVHYARARQVLIVPEIEMPGHNLAALAAYPELGCKGNGYAVTPDFGVLEGVYCAGNDQTFRFLENVLCEVVELIPSHYLHLGGDERKQGLWDNCPRCREVRKQHSLPDETALQKWFMQRVAGYVHQSLHRQTIAWGDIIDAGGIEGQIVQGWLPDQTVKAARQGLDTINSTHEWVYLDYPENEQDHKQRNKPDWMLVLPIEKVYQFDPIPEGLEPEYHHHVLGSEAHLWTEHVPDEAELYHQVFPRLYAFSEAVWSDPGDRNFEDFSKRLGRHPLT